MSRRYRGNRFRVDEEKSGDYEFAYFGRRRYICDVIEEMRKCDKTKNFASLEALIEEAQALANRMEGALSDSKDLSKLVIDVRKARKAYQKLEKEYSALLAKVKPLRPKPAKKQE
jgi:hypothetical protein